MDFENIKIKLDSPYPEIVNGGDDPYIVAILKNLANGRMGETTGAMQYIFQSVVADGVDEDIAKIFEEIAVVEMIHLDMLMHAIKSFGGVPKYEDSQGNFFNTAKLNYSLKLKEMLDNNIAAENVAIENYKMAINKINNESLKNLIKRIIEDEKLHIEVFKKIRDNVRFLSA